MAAVLVSKPVTNGKVAVKLIKEANQSHDANIALAVVRTSEQNNQTENDR